MDSLCPDTYYCADGSHGYDAIHPILLKVSSCIGLVSSLMSCVGASVILLAYLALKDFRKKQAQTIITLLALADLGTAVAGVLGASLFLTYGTSLLQHCYTFNAICQIQSFVFLWSFGCSFIWTSVLAIHLLLIQSRINSNWMRKTVPLYNTVAWLAPLPEVLVMLIIGRLGYSPDFRWTCSRTGTTSTYYWILEVICTVLLFLVYTYLVLSINCKKRDSSNAVRRMSKRLLAILFVYLIMRVWDIVHVVISMCVGRISCSSPHMQIIGFIVSVIQSVAETGQGWVNCILYIISSPEMRKRMFVNPFRKIIKGNISTLQQESAQIQHPTTSSRRHETGNDTCTYLSFPSETA